MEDLLRKHREEQRALQGRVTQKKKSATKKTRKGVNDECAELERQLKESQSLEVAQLRGETPDQENIEPEDLSSLPDRGQAAIPKEAAAENVTRHLESLSVAGADEDVTSKKPNRQKARLARRAAERDAAVKEAEKEAANLPDEREIEKQSMHTAYIAKGLLEYPIRSDGHCLYAAIADQLTSAGIDPKPVVELNVEITEKADYRFARKVTAAYIEKNAEDFLPFLEEPISDYIAKIRSTGEWGGHLEILAMSKAFGRDICVLHGSGQVDKIESGSSSSQPPFWLAYYRHSHGLGEHYNSLRAKG